MVDIGVRGTAGSTAADDRRRCVLNASRSACTAGWRESGAGFVTPFASYAELQKARIPATAVEEAFGKAEAAKWAAKVAEAVETTEYVLMQKAAKDSFVP